MRYVNGIAHRFLEFKYILGEKDFESFSPHFLVIWPIFHNFVA